VLYLQVPAQLA